MIAAEAGLSKPNLLYYFPSKDDIHVTLLSQLMDTWLDPLRELDATGDPVPEILAYVRRKLEMSRDFPRESRLFANEIVQGAPRIGTSLSTDLKSLVDEKAQRHRGLVRRGAHRRYRPSSPDLLDLGPHPALRRFRCSGACCAWPIP
jgi:TetR/AcrR family transcriptional regulator